MVNHKYIVLNEFHCSETESGGNVMRPYATLKKLRSGEIVDLEGIHFKMDDGEITAGDLYIAERNSGPKLLTAKDVDTDSRCIFPTCTAYAFDLHECVKVCEA